VYELLVAPEILVDVPRCHWYVKVGAGAPVHVPVVEDNELPTDAVPVTAGASVLMGNDP
jgi:hypothetical protein